MQMPEAEVSRSFRGIYTKAYKGLQDDEAVQTSKTVKTGKYIKHGAGKENSNPTWLKESKLNTIRKSGFRLNVPPTT